MSVFTTYILMEAILFEYYIENSFNTKFSVTSQTLKISKLAQHTEIIVLDVFRTKK